jgi:hypothetical protein
MTTHMESPATLAACGAPESDQAGASIVSDNTKSLRLFQVSRLVRLYAVNSAMAETIAPLVFLEALR